MSVYSKFRKVDISDASEVEKYHLNHAVSKNVRLFHSLNSDPIKNLKCVAISPFTGKKVTPTEHFGIDSDPWMHSILYVENGRQFIVICQGLTNASHLGSIVLPKEGIILCHYESWYYNGAYLSRIERNVPRILNFFRWRKTNKITSVPAKNKPMQLIYAIGNQRVGDFIMQLLLLDELLRHPLKGKAFDIHGVYVNRASEFMEAEVLFPEIASKFQKLNSFSHIEYHARYFPAMLFADVRVLSNKRALNYVKNRMNCWLSLPGTKDQFAGILKDFSTCTFTIWVNLELEKRIWAEQETALPEIINKLCGQILRKNEKVGIVFNGMTGYAGKDVAANLDKIIQKERKIANKMVKLIQHPVHLHTACGSTLAEKIALGSLCDFVIAPLGSASMVPSLLLDKPGIVYAFDSDERATFAGPETIILNSKYISERKDLTAAVKFDMANQSYSFDWKNLYKQMNSNFRFERGKSNQVIVTRKKSK